MSWYLILQSALTLGLLALIGFIIYALIQLHRTLQTLDDVLKNVNRELPNVLIKLEHALDGVNSELERVDNIVSSFKDVSAKVQSTTSLAQRAVVLPVARLVSLVSGAQSAVSSLIGRKKSG